MSEELTKQTASIVPVDGGNIEVSASTPNEMVQGHNAMIQWAERKLEAIKNEFKELRDAYEHAKARKWKSDTLKRHAAIAEKRVTFYEKFKAALMEGYCVVPNFPVTLFAIRTTNQKPAHKFAMLRSSSQRNFEQDAKLLQIGEGDYQNPQPNICQGPVQKVVEGSQTVEKRQFWAESWDELEFPANMARLHVMEATTRAMALKIFDEIGFLPADYKRNPDPIMIGRLIDPRPVGYGQPRKVSFMIAWHIDTRTL